MHLSDAETLPRHFPVAITLTLAGLTDEIAAGPASEVSSGCRVYYFAGNVWVTVAVVYLAACWLKRRRAAPGAGSTAPAARPGRVVARVHRVLRLTSISRQYLIIWNANLPEETFLVCDAEKAYCGRSACAGLWPLSAAVSAVAPH